MKCQNTVCIALGTVVLLLTPLLAKWAWTLSDFIIMGALIFCAGLIIDFVIRKQGKYRAIGIIAIVFLFLWLWAELSVGVFTNWGS